MSKKIITLGNLKAYMEPLKDRLNRATAGPNPNLLDNPDFKINQQTRTSYVNKKASDYSTKVTDTVDRWIAKSNGTSANPATLTVTPTDEGIELDCDGKGQFYQKTENALRTEIADKSCTLSICYKSNKKIRITGQLLGTQSQELEASADFTTASFQFVSKTIIGSDQSIVIELKYGAEATHQIAVIKWIKLEIGSEATPFISPNEDLELLKCRKYLIPVYVHDLMDITASTSTTCVCTMLFPREMRIVPTYGGLKLSQADMAPPIQVTQTGSTATAKQSNVVAALKAKKIGQHACQFEIPNFTGLTPGASYNISSEDGIIECFSAEL